MEGKDRRHADYDDIFFSFMTLFQKDFLIGMMRSMDYCRSWKYVFLKMPQVTATKLPMVGVIKLHIS